MNPTLPQQQDPMQMISTVLQQLINHPQMGQQIRSMITQHMQPFQQTVGNAAMAMQPNKYVQTQNGGYQPYTNLPGGKISVNGQTMIPPISQFSPDYTAIGANQTGHAIPFSRRGGGRAKPPTMPNQGRSNANTRTPTSTKTH